jgi:outer membrane protein assembly factor BamB
VTAGRPSVLWSVRMSGPVLQPPATAGDTVFAVDATGQLAALDAADGRRRWTAQLPGGPSGPPRTTADAVYVGTTAGVICGFDAGTGEPRWQVAAPVHTGTPTADGAGNLLVTLVRAGERHELASVEPRTGRQRWTHRSYTSFISEVTVAGDAVLVHHHQGECVRLDATTGQVDWSASYGSRYSGYAPVTEHRGVVYAGSGDGDLLALDLADGTIRAAVPAIRTDLAAADHPGDIFYSQRQMRYAPSVQTAPLVVDDSVVTLQRNGRIACYPLELGVQRWSEYTAPPLEPTLTTASGHVLTTTGQRLQARDVTTGDVAWKIRIGSPFQRGSYPLGHGRYFYTGSGRRLRAYDAGPT